MNIEVYKALGVVLGGVLATIAPYIASWIKKQYSKDQEATSFLHNAEHRVQINEILVELRALTGANRVAIVEYHNGNTAINGLPFNYASMTYEKADYTTREMLMNFQKIPISPLCELLLQVHNSKEGYARVDSNCTHTDVIEIHKYYGVDTAYVFRIGDHIKYGTVHLMWIHEVPDLDSEALQEIHYKVMYINELMKKMKKY